MSSRAGALAKFLIIDLLGSVVWFPVWWYTRGLRRIVTGSIDAMRYRWREYGLAIWVRNFFVPMYGQYDVAGRLISVLVRFAVLIGRLVAFGIESLIYALGIAAWIVAPAFFVLMAIVNGARGI